jgi:hypothetical protein
VLVAFLVGSLVQWARQRRLSHGLSAALWGSLLAGLLTRHTALYTFSVGLLILRAYVRSKEQRQLQGHPKSERGGQSEEPLTRLVSKTKPPARLKDPVAQGASDDEHFAALRDPIELTIPTEPATVLCKGGGRLEIAAGDLRVRVSFVHTRRTEVDRVQSTLVFADSKGRQWELRTRYDAGLFTDEFEDDTRRAAREKDTGFVPWTSAPDVWTRALRERCVLKQLRALLDSRMYVDLMIGSRKHIVRLKYESPSTDVALLGQDLLVRVSELTERVSSKIGAVEGDEHHLDDFAIIPPFAYLVPVSLLLPFAAPDYHRPILEGDEKALPKPERKRVRAALLEGRGTPQPNVTFTSDSA